LTRLIFFVVLAGFLAFSQGISSILNLTALALLAWNLFRSRQELAHAWSSARRLDHPTPESPP
jgi:hypothetical protein